MHNQITLILGFLLLRRSRDHQLIPLETSVYIGSFFVHKKPEQHKNVAPASLITFKVQHNPQGLSMEL